MREFLPPNPALQKLRAQEQCTGTFIFSSDPSITEIIGLSGFDVGIIDLEHATTSLAMLPGQARAAHAGGMSWWIRVGTISPEPIARSLDAGAQGIILPHFGLDMEASMLGLRALSYAPDGIRPSCTGTRASGYGQDFGSYARRSNDEVFGIGLIEDAEVVDRIEEVFDTTGIGIVLPGGAGDLATSLGVHGQGNHPRVLAAIERVHRAAKARPHMRIGAYVSDLSSLPALRELGFDFYIYSIDYKVLAAAYHSVYKAITER
ncbi:HpcH/HpaI aldolase family protein [Novosphingobium malaysiense]|uniref:HpcH/HpaI aldolase family protein n=1 Tax=Novosphingobium malaysiense TaxID=1348853 RepID=UPI00068F1B12|nr:aldolase/citrate lyase family protein [Novosphingobium malaysiense]